MKKCFKCGDNKPLSDYYGHKGMKDGRLNKCKTCTKLDTKKREDELRLDPDFVESEKTRHREKYHRLQYKEKHKPTKEQKKRAIVNYKEKYPEKVSAKIKSRRVKATTKGNHMHHWSYNDQHYKDVIELSVADHNLVHRYTSYDQERKMYRTLEGVLIDSREDAICYYKKIGANPI